MKSGFIAIIGRPNVGKSTLMNAILGEKVAITANKPQTTRNTIRGIYTRLDEGEDGVQLIFIDTPGIHKGKTKLGKNLTDMAFNTLREVDLILFVVDGGLKEGPGDKIIAERLKEVKTPKFAVINKIDKMNPEEFKEIFDEYKALDIFDKVIGISATEGAHIKNLVDDVEEYMPEGPMYFPEDMVTDHPERFVVSEIIREKALEYLEDEVPHGIAVEIENFEEKPNLTRISAIIYCERKSHKGIIIGKGGKKLKGIGKGARLEIEALLGTKVYLELFVKVKENWRDSDFALNNFGYIEK